MSVLDDPSEGTWSVFASKVVRERDEARYERDEARDELAAMAAERDKWRAVADANTRLREDMKRERDEAIASLNTCDAPHDVGGERLEDAVIEAAISLVNAWRDADDADQAHYRAQSLTDIRERFAVQNRVTNAKGEMTAASLRLLDAVTVFEQAAGDAT
jgi:hypothetical protein